MSPKLIIIITKFLITITERKEKAKGRLGLYIKPLWTCTRRGNLWVLHFSNVLCIVNLLNLYTACKKDIKEVPSTVGLITTAYYVEKGPFAEAKIGPYELFDK